VKAVVVFAALVVGLLGAAPAQAAEAQVWVFLYMDQPKAQGAYVPADQESNTGTRATVTWLATGSYRVDLPGVSASGVPMVTAVHGSSVHCQVKSFSTAGQVFVSCYAGGSPTNSRFTFTFASATPPGSGASGAYGYVFDNQPALDIYRNPPGFNSAGGPIEIDHAAGSNLWTVRFSGQAFDNPAGNVQVTAVGSTPSRCAVSQWSPNGPAVDVQVRCDRANTQWTLVYANDRSITGGTTGFFGYLQADDPDNPAYTPSLPRNRGQDGFIHTVSRSGRGKYQVQVYGPVKLPIALQLSVNDSSGNFCVLNSWTPTNQQPAALVNLSCYDTNRNLADSVYSLNYYAP
jgi:hypothetical protein